MTTYTAKVTEEFIMRRDYLVFNSNRRARTLHQHMMHADCEWAEHHVTTLYETGHKLHNDFAYDTKHDIYGRCEFKHTPKSGRIYISKWCQEQDFDHFVFWRFVNRDWSKPLAVGDIVTYEIYDYIPKETVLSNMKDEVYYEYIRPTQES